jgi:UDP-N-acetylglucosamine acyltransferase
MAQPPAPVHPTALIDARADLAPDVRVGAFCIIEGPVCLGPGCVVGPRAHLIGPLRLGSGNRVHGGAVLGAPPQHLREAGSAAGVEVGAGNTFRAGATVHQPTGPEPTRLGNGNRLLAGSHVGHDCRLGDGCVLGEDALLGGHCVVDDGARLGSHVAVHQFCRLGRLSRLRPVAVTTKDVPPFVVQYSHNLVGGLNVAGLRRAGMGGAEMCAVRRLYEIVYRRGLTIRAALAEAEQELGGVAAVREFIAFVRRPGRGINGTRPGT